MKIFILILLLLLISGCEPSTTADLAEDDCSQWVLERVPKDSLVKKVSIAEVDKLYESASNECWRKEWAVIKSELKAEDEIWEYHRRLSDGGYAVVRSGVPIKALVVWVD